MKKIFLIFFLTFFLTATPDKLVSDTFNSNSGCTNEINSDFLKNYEKLKIERLEIETLNYRDWTVNSIKIITSNTRFVDDIYKKRFKAKITLYFEDGSKCFYTGRIRHSGDQKDHISLHDNYILQSLDVHLDNGNIRGITKFKLLRPNTRGVLEDVILQTQLLRELNYLAPRSIKVRAKINEAESIMLFQEKASKELLEFNNRREGPILEANEKYFWKALKDIPDNQLSNWSVGVVPLHNQSAKHLLAKLTNSNLIIKNENLKEVSLNALTKLNLIYLYYSSRFQDEKNKFNYWEYDLDNTLLGLYNKKNIRKLDIYNLILQSTNSTHGLGSNNRKFFWNSFENYFEPINYDANPNINRGISNQSFRLPVSENFYETFDLLSTQIKNVQIKQFTEKLIFSGLDYSMEDVQIKFNKILSNIETLKNNYYSFLSEDLKTHNQLRLTKNLIDFFYKTRNEVDPNTYIVKQIGNNNDFFRCETLNQECEKFDLDNINISNLVEGDLSLDDRSYQYLGKSINLEKNKDLKGYTRQKIENTDIYFEKGVELFVNESEKILRIYQRKPGARIFIKNGSLKNYKIDLEGFNLRENDQNLDLKSFPPNYPINNTILTGCLTFANMKVEKLLINAINSSCEDTINFINVTGQINKISIINSFSDALDIDFSSLKIDEINIELALNDCADFSAGKYKLGTVNLKSCGDKAISVGEKSLVEVDNLFAYNSNFGIASKDSSIVDIENVELKYLETCYAAYKKKQEFYGGIISIKNAKCSNYYREADIDGSSKIYIKANLLKNDKFGKFYKNSNLEIQEVEGKEISKNFHKDFKALNNDNSINVVVEISAGMKEKWEVSKSNKGSLIREFYMGKPRSIKYNPYPINYGIIPNTVLPLRVGGDGDPLDVVLLGSSLAQGKIVKSKVIGTLKMRDFGEIDDKVVAVPVNSDLSKYENLLHLKNEDSNILNEIVLWFENYKGKNVVNFLNYGTVSEAKELINFANKEYKKSGLKPRS